MTDPEKSPSHVTPFTILRSALSSLIGVQSNKNRERDFASGKFWHFFVAGAIVTVVFLLSVWAAVKMLLASAS